MSCKPGFRNQYKWGQAAKVMHFNYLVSTSTITEITVEGNTLANFYDKGRGI